VITDAQVHIWNANTPEEPWGPGAESHLPDPMPAERMLGLMDDAGIDRAVISPAGVAANRSPACAQAAAAKYPKRFRVMAWFVPSLPEQWKLLPRWMEQPGVCSLRLSMNEPEHQKMFAEDAFEPVWKACIEQDMAVAVWTRSGPALMEPVLKKYPDLTFIIDHFGWAVPGEARESKVKAMESLARFRNVHVKVSSLPLVSGSPPPEYEDLHPMIKRVHAAFGAERMMWASDQTQTMGKNRGTYAQNADIIRKYAAAYLPARDVQEMMHGTATRVFKWPVQ
jgi:predicted TIM-barrel fold metal-dependent hydrolase